MTDAGSNALKGSILYTVLVLMLLGSLWTTVGSRGWPSKLPSPWH